MKISRLALNFVRSWILRDIKARRKNYPPRDEYRHFIDVPYIDDKNKHHTYDVYLANESNRKHCCFIDIHGGSYIFGEHQDNYPYAKVLLDAGFDVVLVDYIPNNGKIDIEDIFKDCASNLQHLFANLQEFDLKNDKFVITGDSAGGHLALLLSIAIQNKEVREKLGLDLPEFDPIATVVACPVYDFENIGVGSMRPGALKRMLGPKYNDKAHLAKFSPKTYIEYHHIPLFLSTCKNDFIRPESISLNKDMSGKEGYQFIDINSDDKNIDHVHNITKIYLKESIEVNNAIVAFVDKLL